MDAVVDLDLAQYVLRKRQVRVLSRALNRFVALKSSPEGWQPVTPASGLALGATSTGGDVDVHIGKKPMPAPTEAAEAPSVPPAATESDTVAPGIGGEVYRMTASIPLDPETSRDTQGPFSAYLSELRDWQAVLECPGLRSMWNYYVRSCNTLEMLDANTSITRTELRNPAPGQSKEFAHRRDMLMVETSLVDPTTVVYVSTSLPTTHDDPAYLRERAPFKRAYSALWAWCVEIVTPSIDAIPPPPSSSHYTGNSQHQQQLMHSSPSPSLSSRAKPRVCVQVTCFLHLDLDSSWKSNNALACRAAANLIPSLVAHLRLHGAPPRIARIGPSISIDRSEWHRPPAGDTPVWEVSYSVMCASPPLNAAAAAAGATSSLPPPLVQSKSMALESVGQPIIASILDLETASPTKPHHRHDHNHHSHHFHSGTAAASSVSPPPSFHARKVSTLTSYLSSSFERRQSEASSAFGTHAGGIVRDGEELALVVTRARLGSCVLEFVVDASGWRMEGLGVDISLSVSGLTSAEHLYASIKEMQAAAPELFSESQLRLSRDNVATMMARRARKGISQPPSSTADHHYSSGPGIHSKAYRRHRHCEQQVVAELAAMQLVRCFSIASHKRSRLRYLVRILNLPSTEININNNNSNSNNIATGGGSVPEIVVNGNRPTATTATNPGALAGESVDKTYRVSVVVRKGASSSSNSGGDGKTAATGVVVNGISAEVTPFTLDPPAYVSSLRPKPRAASGSSNSNSNSNNKGAARENVAPTWDSESTAVAPALSPHLLVTATSEHSGAALRMKTAEMEESTPDGFAQGGSATDGYEEEEEYGGGDGGTQSAAEMSINDLQAVNQIPATATTRAAGIVDDMASVCEIPFARFRQVVKPSSTPPPVWSSFGTSAAGSITVSRTDIRAKKEQQQQQNLRAADSDSDANETLGSSSASAGAAGTDKTTVSLSGTVLRAEALIEGWTIFDVFSILGLGSGGGGGAEERPVSGLWATAVPLEQIAPTAELHYRKTSGTWATAARDAVVCRAWTVGGRSNRIDVAECSVDGFLAGGGKPQGAPESSSGTVRAELGLSAWRLEKAKMPPPSAMPALAGGKGSRQNLQQLQNQNQQHQVGDGAAEGDRRNGSSGGDPSGNASSTTTTGSLALDAEFENQRRKQHAVRITHYLRYNPRGWLNPNTSGAAAVGDELAVGFKRMGAALGIGPAQPPPVPRAAAAQEESAVFQTMLLPALKDAVCNDVLRVVRHLDEHGARPTVMWSRNANIVSTEATDDSVQVQYRMAGWGSGSGLERRASAVEVLDQNQYVEIEARIEHRIWAHRHNRTSGNSNSNGNGSAVVAVAVEPFYATSAVACFVDPESDPHATRVRVSHHRAQLLPRVDGSDADGVFMAWPTVRLTVSRCQNGDAAGLPAVSAKPVPSSLAPPPGASNGATAGASPASASAVARLSPKPAPAAPAAVVAQWSVVPPRITVNAADARVRYLRRDGGGGGRAFYARCQSVASRDAARLVREPPYVDEHLFLERLPDPAPPQQQQQQHEELPAASGQPPPAENHGHAAYPSAPTPSSTPTSAPSVAIEKYSVLAAGHQNRVATPNEFAAIMTRLFARIRHEVEIELGDPQSARSRLASSMRRSGSTSGSSYGSGGDARSVASLVTAVADEEALRWTRANSSNSNKANGSYAACFQRTVGELHSEIPVTVATDVLQGVGASTVAQLLLQPWERADWDTELFAGAGRRELEYVPDSAGGAGAGAGVGVYYSGVHAPLLCDRRDALTVCAVERAAFLPTRRRLRNWEETHETTAAARVGALAGGCGNSSAALGDYHDPTFTLVEASVPGSQPLSTAVRANVALYAIRVDPVDSFERVVAGRPLPLPSCRITVACCLDLAGAMPLPLRRAVSARIPELHIARIRARLQAPRLWPMLRAPSRLRHAVPRWAAGPADLAGAAVAAEVSRESVDGRRLVFYRPLDAARVVHEAAAGRASGSSYVAVVAMSVPAASGRARPGGAHPSPVFPEAAGALAHLRSLRKDHDEEERVGDFSDAESSPASPPSSSDAIGEGAASDRSLRLVPVVSDIAISGRAAAVRFPHGFDVRVATSLVPSTTSSASSSASSENARPIASTDSAAFAAADAIPAARWVGDAGDGWHRLAVYVFLRRNQATEQKQAARRMGSAAADGDLLLVRTVLLPPDDDDDDGGGSSRALKQSAAMSGTAGGGASCTVVIRQVPPPARASRETSRIITQDATTETAYPAVWCNGQRLRVHRARPSRESLLFVATTAGEYLNACGECGGFGCDVFASDHMDTAGGVSSGVVGYASDTDEVVLRDTSKDSNRGGGHVAADAVDDGDSGVMTTARRVSSDAGGSGLLGAALRRRIGAGVSSNNAGNNSGSRSSSTSTGCLAASASAALAIRDNNTANSSSPATLPSSSSPFHKPSPPLIATSSLSFGKTPPAAYRRRRGPMAAGSAGGRLVVPIKRLVFAVFLPVRRLVIGRRGGAVAADPSSYISHSTGGSLAGLTSHPLPHTTATARKSVLALVVVLLVGCVCVAIGMRVSQLLVAAVIAHRSPPSL
ncbi:hypothetical protein GGI11_001095 [Coemansia sp. RSA 2049]|nr:hypothetical protein GGI11_001095 [Coemansia sp. RSA 2049]